MAYSLCTQCGLTFSGESAFDLHQGRMKANGRGVTECKSPESVGLVFRKGRGVWGFPTPDEPVVRPIERVARAIGGTVKPTRQGAPRTRSDAPTSAETRPCQGCYHPMRKKPGRGRWPRSCTMCGGTGVRTNW